MDEGQQVGAWRALLIDLKARLLNGIRLRVISLNVFVRFGRRVVIKQTLYFYSAAEGGVSSDAFLELEKN